MVRARWIVSEDALDRCLMAVTRPLRVNAFRQPMRHLVGCHSSRGLPHKRFSWERACPLSSCLLAAFHASLNLNTVIKADRESVERGETRAKAPARSGLAYNSLEFGLFLSIH